MFVFLGLRHSRQVYSTVLWEAQAGSLKQWNGGGVIGESKQLLKSTWTVNVLLLTCPQDHIERKTLDSSVLSSFSAEGIWSGQPRDRLDSASVISPPLNASSSESEGMCSSKSDDWGRPSDVLAQMWCVSSVFLSFLDCSSWTQVPGPGFKKGAQGLSSACVVSVKGHVRCSRSAVHVGRDLLPDGYPRVSSRLRCWCAEPSRTSSCFRGQTSQRMSSSGPCAPWTMPASSLRCPGIIAIWSPMLSPHRGRCPWMTVSGRKAGAAWGDR